LTIRWQNQRVIESRIRALAKERAEQLRQRVIPEWVAKLALLTEAEIKEQLRLALWGCLNFGGVGARTRRGLGAISTDDEQFALLNANRSLQYSMPATHIVLHPQNGDALAAWAKAVDVYRQFRCRNRQAGTKDRIRNGQVKHNTRSPGRTDWPEPDSIRLLTGYSLKGATYSFKKQPFSTHDHSTPISPVPSGGCFPRAILGLPIITKFADEPTPDTTTGLDPACSDKDRDPKSSTLLSHVPAADGGAISDGRMASPVLTRPLKIDGQWHPALTVLRSPYLKLLQAELQGIRANPAGGRERFTHHVEQTQIVGANVKQFPPMRGWQFALAALINFAVAKNGFEQRPKNGVW
jgi:CRISPR-associated protein Cmr1